MKPRRVVWISAGAAAVLLALLELLIREKSPAETVRLSETQLSRKVHAYYQRPNPATLAAVKAAIADHRKAIERAKLSSADQEAMERSLYEQLYIVRGIARNDDLKL